MTRSWQLSVSTDGVGSVLDPDWHDGGHTITDLLQRAVCFSWMTSDRGLGMWHSRAGSWSHQEISGC